MMHVESVNLLEAMNVLVQRGLVDVVNANETELSFRLARDITEQEG